MYDYHIVASIKTLATFESVCAWVVCKHSHITIIEQLLRGVPHISEAHTELIGRLIDVRAHGLLESPHGPAALCFDHTHIWAQAKKKDI